MKNNYWEVAANELEKENKAMRIERDELRAALACMVGVFDTASARRRVRGEFAKEARRIANLALTPKEGE